MYKKRYPLLSCILILLLLSGCNDSPNDSLDKLVEKQKARNCVEPENPYDEHIDSGHYAGFEWAIKNEGECEGNSESFNEGCQEYYNQTNEYDDCMSDEKS